MPKENRSTGDLAELFFVVLSSQRIPSRILQALPGYKPRCVLKHVGGFTLIEVLLVVAVIALLISILIPSIAAARRQSRSLACAANLRTTGMAMYYYTEASHTYFPPHGTWAERCYPYIQKRGAGKTPTPAEWADKIFEVSPEFYSCPDDTELHMTTWNRMIGGHKFKTRCWLSYGFNGFLSNYPADLGRLRTNNYFSLKDEQRKATEVKRPNTIVMFTDSNNDDICRVMEVDWRFEDASYHHGGFLEVHHKTGNNFLFADNHILYQKVLAPPLPQNTPDFLTRMNGRGVPDFPQNWIPVDGIKVSSRNKQGR